MPADQGKVRPYGVGPYMALSREMRRMNFFWILERGSTSVTRARDRRQRTNRRKTHDSRRQDEETDSQGFGKRVATPGNGEGNVGMIGAMKEHLASLKEDVAWHRGRK